MTRIALFASGSGSNVENIAHYFEKSTQVEISAVFSNNPSAFVLKRAQNLDIPSFTFSKDEFYNTNRVLQLLEELNIDFIVLAGFLWLIPMSLIKKYPNKIINIHPALLPKFGGKGMYGNHVHEAVINNSEKETGITIHLVNEVYDNGKILFQAKCKITKEDTIETVANKVHKLEYQFFPKIIKDFIENQDY